MTLVLPIVILTSLSVTFVSVIAIHHYFINELTDRIMNIREKEKENKYINEIIKIKKKRKNSLIKRKRKTSVLSKKDGLKSIFHH